MPNLKVMLAASEIPNIKDLRFPLMTSPKLDGVRGAFIEGLPHSRKMLPFENQFMLEWATEHAQALSYLDGEFIVGSPTAEHEEDDVFNRTAGPIGKVGGTPDFTFYAFEHWHAPWKAMDRYLHLKAHLESSPIPRVQLIAQKLVYNAEEFLAEYYRLLDLGYEGMMLKDPDAPYFNGRSSVSRGTLMKWKEWADSEAQVLAVNQAKSNTNEAKKDELGHTKRSSAKAGKVLRESIGSWTVKDIYSGVVFRCKPGHQSEAELASMWEKHKLESQEGLVMTYTYQKVGTLRKPRFSSFKRWRPLMDIPADAPHLVLDKPDIQS